MLVSHRKFSLPGASTSLITEKVDSLNLNQSHRLTLSNKLATPRQSLNPELGVMNFSVLFKTVRKAMKLNQLEMAKKLGVSQPHISEIESGDDKPGAAVFIRLARLTLYDRNGLWADVMRFIEKQ